MAVAVAADGVLWAGTLEQGVSRFDGSNWITYTVEDGLANNTVREIAVDLEGGVWFGTVNGVSYFKDETWTTYTEDDGLVKNDVRSIVVAPDGALWFGTLGGGVSRFLPPD
jgi:ligand-binding sensor domain-containing protein